MANSGICNQSSDLRAMKRGNPVTRIIFVRTVQASLCAIALHVLTGWPLTGSHALGLFVTPFLCLYFVFVFVAPWSWGLSILNRLRTVEKVVVLSFDDGPSEMTFAVLDCLYKHKTQATFFVLGEAAERYPELIRRMNAEGHTVGIHAWRHAAFVGLGSRRIADEVHCTQEAIRRACPEAPPTRWLRPPHGFKSIRALWFARTQGLRLAAWSSDSRDYRDTQPESIAWRVTHNLRPGAIILLHDGPRNSATVEALPLILRGLQKQHFSCVPLERVF